MMFWFMVYKIRNHKIYRMFKNNSYIQEPYNYSFQDEEDLIDNKQNRPSLSNKHHKYQSNEQITLKLEKIEVLMNKHYELELQNRKMLIQQADKINRMQKKLTKICKIMDQQDESHKKQSFLSVTSVEINSNNNNRMKSESMRTCRSKKSSQKSMLHSLEQRQKVINQQIHKRITSQLSSHKQSKKPLKFFMQHS